MVFRETRKTARETRALHPEDHAAFITTDCIEAPHL
jgi:hypothetical protein